MATAVVQRNNEQVYRLIYGLQIRPLKSIAQYGGTAPKAVPLEIYNDARKALPEAYEDFGFDTWLGFLLAQELIGKSDFNGSSGP